jgi:hypothetical protein
MFEPFLERMVESDGTLLENHGAILGKWSQNGRIIIMAT